MAIIDPRLIPLIEILVAADADWLAFEILEAVQMGRVSEETDDELLLAQSHVRRRKHNAMSEWQQQWPSRTPQAQPIGGDEQLLWVAEYIARRFQDAVAMLTASLAQMDAILNATPGDRVSQMSDIQGSRVTLVLQSDGGQLLGVDREFIMKAAPDIENLRNALTAWADSERTRERT